MLSLVLGIELAPCRAGDCMIDNGISRREFLGTGSFSAGSLALAWLLQQDDAFAKPAKPELEPR